ncbi:MAG: carboxypeptidase regulatory-like domain-containing protein [Acidobacteriota bacterium]|nr:carboxypeptidase regulatory-like domain-containing protein [Acidobacteriota bacterium]
MQRTLFLFAFCALLWPAGPASAQGVTTGALAGTVVNAEGALVEGASVIAIHLPSGTTYEATSRADGRFQIIGMRVGGPYSVTVAHAGAGNAFEPQTKDDVTVNLGVSTDLEFKVTPITLTESVTVTGTTDPVFASDRTGAATQISRLELQNLPTISNRLESVTRLTPQSGGNMQFGGVDNRLNNITIDGAAFNNSFGLGGTPGDRTGVAPISLNAIEQVQVNIAPYDVRQGNFIGAGVNSVTRSGTNQFRASLYHQMRDDSLVGTEAGSNAFNPGTFEYRNTGGWVSGPVLRNKLFFFGNFEDELETRPATTFRANNGGETVGGSVTRVLKSDLDTLSAFLSSNFNYATGAYQDYPGEIPGRRFLFKTDYNLNNNNKFTARYSQLDSETFQLVSDSSSLGFGSRRTRTDALNFENSNYTILENIKGGSGEWNSVWGDSIANNFVVGFSSHDESRGALETLFPIVDILNAGTTYTTFGSEPFTPNNELRYKQFQVKNDITKFGEKHSFVGGLSYQRYNSENVFFPGSQSAYVYNSLADFYADANSYLANPNRTVSPVTLRRFQVRWSNIPGLDKPLQPLKVQYMGAYAQDDWRPRSDLTVTLGVRMDVPLFEETGFENPIANALTFRDEDGNAVQYQTQKLPDANILWSPRVGFNWSVNPERATQVRGGTGIFTGPPAYVWISNQIGENGMLTGFAQFDNTTVRPFNPNPDHYKPATVTGAPATSTGLAVTDPDFKFPQVWRTNIAVDHKLPLGFTGTGEFIYNRDVNGVYYINANLPAAQSAFVGPDTRARYTSNRINSGITSNIVLKNQNEGRSWNAAASVTRTFNAGVFFKAAYSYGEAQNTVDPGSIAFGSWNNNQHAGDPNNPGLGYAGAMAGHRLFAAASYSKEYFNFGATTISTYIERRTGGQASYVYGGDMNGDGGTSNDLLYIPNDASELVFLQQGAFTPAQQAAAWNAYIEQDAYLSEHRGEYAERGAVFLPMVTRMDVSLAQDIFRSLGGMRHSLQFRIDAINFGNLINSDWGVGTRLVNNQPLQPAGVNAQGSPQFRMRVINGALMSNSTETTSGLGDVYQLRFALRYSFN